MRCKITGHTNVEFHEEKQEKKEQEDEQGDDKDKNVKMIRNNFH
ncbi:hypothetical protein C2W64_00247 [Brevibacillus laterosporus]|nr:hypothetical protein C2W64_00247 [Brevibacillus laterosporus]